MPRPSRASRTASLVFSELAAGKHSRLCLPTLCYTVPNLSKGVRIAFVQSRFLSMMVAFKAVMMTSPAVAPAIEASTLHKVRIRILPFIFVLFVVCFLDRINIVIAALTMNQELAITNQQFGLVLGVFFFGYFIFEIPSNLLLHKMGARVRIASVRFPPYEPTMYGVWGSCRHSSLMLILFHLVVHINVSISIYSASIIKGGPNPTTTTVTRR